jgi:hypothetical protein
VSKVKHGKRSKGIDPFSRWFRVSLLGFLMHQGGDVPCKSRRKKLGPKLSRGFLPGRDEKIAAGPGGQVADDAGLNI